MTSPKAKLKPKGKAPASISHLAAEPIGASSSTPTGTMSSTNKSTKIKLQFKDKNFALRNPSEGAPVGASSSTPTGIMSSTNKSTKIKPQIKNTTSRPSLTGVPKDRRVQERNPSRSYKTQTETLMKTELQAHENESAASKTSDGYAAHDNSSPSTVVHTDEIPVEVPSLENPLELLPLAKLRSRAEAATAKASPSVQTGKTPSTKPSKVVILKLPPAKLAALSTSTQAVPSGPSSKVTSSSSNLASSTIEAPPLPIAADPNVTYSSRGRMIIKSQKAREQGSGNNAVAQSSVAQSSVAQNSVAQNAGQKRKANEAATSSKKRVKFADTEDHESADTTPTHRVTVARRTIIKIGTRSPLLRSKARAEAVLEALKEARSRAHLLAWQEEEEERNRHARAKMGNLVRDWLALEAQRDLEAEQANTGAL
ncbi:uncharacterized protein EAE97_003660 [Botrytis byssoidea]|uniref:Uncharacterized protein n=1 Tax=Botrytis byssoidea TaxID=139641 RepID=A0A9P5ITN3_9HELO|nr:uncharacterized protein EAE97_003660 [Botrytis byssoidea]KAF7948249.1 hypothetical protein EAE97_003660 [Botrytis byssoidea]